MKDNDFGFFGSQTLREDLVRQDRIALAARVEIYSGVADFRPSVDAEVGFLDNHDNTCTLGGEAVNNSLNDGCVRVERGSLHHFSEEFCIVQNSRVTTVVFHDEMTTKSCIQRLAFAVDAARCAAEWPARPRSGDNRVPSLVGSRVVSNLRLIAGQAADFRAESGGVNGIPHPHVVFQKPDLSSQCANRLKPFKIKAKRKKPLVMPENIRTEIHTVKFHPHGASVRTFFDFFRNDRDQRPKTLREPLTKENK